MGQKTQCSILMRFICINNPVTLALDWFLLTRFECFDTDPPKETLAKVSPTNIQEGQTVNLTCSAKGRPDPTYTWFRNEMKMHSGAQWEIKSITDSQSGNFSCEAQNRHGATESQPVFINVTCMSFLCLLQLI